MTNIHILHIQSFNIHIKIVFYYNLPLSSGYFGTRAHIYIDITVEKHCFSKTRFLVLLNFDKE